MTSITQGAIAAGHPKTAEAGAEMLRQGGNAFDAAAAAILASCVAEFTLASLAGGGFLLAHTADDRNILFDFFTQTPRQKRPLDAVDFYPVLVNFGITTQEFHVGLGSMAVPGTLAGVFHVQQTLGRLPLQAIAEPAIHYARTGVKLGPFQAYCLQILQPILLAADGIHQHCAPTGTLLQAGDTLFMPELANTLEYLSQEGIRPFYEGEIAQSLVKDCQHKGGYLTLDDLRQYQVIERNPLKAVYRGNTLLTNPPPSSGGSLIAFALSLLESLDFSSIALGSQEHLSALVQVMRLTNLARKDGYDNALYDPDVAQRFLATEHLAQYAQQLAIAPNKFGSTTHISVIDGEGNAASVTTSNGEGSSYVIPGTGVMVNNMLGEADLHPNGFHTWQEDVRISSMMAPTLVLKDHRPEIVLGSGGSNRIRTAILQVISNIIDFQMPVYEAVNRSRLHWEDGVLNLEPNLFDGAIDRPFDRTQFPWNEHLIQWESQNMFFGGVHTVFEAEDGALSGAGDGRRSGAVAIVPSAIGHEG